MLNFIKNCAVSLAYCMLVLLVAWSLAVSAAPTTLGVSFVSIANFTGWFAVTAAAAGAFASILKTRRGEATC